MKIMVFDVPAELGGSSTILKQYYQEAINSKEIEWIFILSTHILKEYENVRILRYPWIKKSWFHRLFFDEFIAHKLVKKHQIDEVLSLQNLVIPKIKVKQTLYLHQPLPFIEKKYSITENFKFWIYQNIISEKIFKSIREADKVIIQTSWIRDSAILKANVTKEKFILEQPKIDYGIDKMYSIDNHSEKQFFYPSSALVYKNHLVIVNTCKLLKNKGVTNYRVVFTLSGDENRNAKMLKKIVIEERLPIEFIGYIDRELVYDYYSRSTLIFPSYIETFGLPLLEARLHECPIIASNCSFSHEVLKDYSKATFFDPFSSEELASIMLRFIKKVNN